MKRAPFRLGVLAPALLLAGCSDWFAAPVAEGGEASGEVLPGSVSDAMIPLEQLDSEAPLAPRQEGPTAEELDAEQPLVTPVEGVEGAAPGAEAGAAPAAPAAESQ